MLYCINPDCSQPRNPDGATTCAACQSKLTLLRQHYRIVDRLGEGGFAKTYLAEDTDNFNRRCAVKQLAPNVRGASEMQQAVKLFEQEARQLQILGRHPQIPTLHGYFEEQYWYVVQEFIDGQDLWERSRQQGVCTEDELRDILQDLLSVLQFVHENNVIHRDITPSNIIRRRSDGKLVLIDFGISKQLSSKVLSKPGTIIGSEGYAAWEQLKGGTVSPATDLFGVGVTCFYLLSGVDINDLYLNKGYSWLQDWKKHGNYRASASLAKILDKLLQKEAKKRYQSASEVLRELTSQPISIPTPPPPVPVGSSGVKKPRSNLFSTRKRDWVVAIVGIAAGVVTVATYLQANPVSVNFFSFLNFLNPFRDETLISTFTGHSVWVRSVAIGPDGKTLASGSFDDTIKLWNLETRQEIATLTGHSDWVLSVTISPDDQTLVSGSADGTIKLWNLETRQEIVTLTGHSGNVLSVAFSPNGKTLASGSADDTIKLWNLETRQEIVTLPGHSNSVDSVAISPDGKTLASGSADDTIKLWNLETGQEIATLTGHSDWVLSVAFSPDSKILASGSLDDTIKLWNLETRQEIATLTGHSGNVLSVAFSPDGKILASGSVDGTIKLWRVNRLAE